MAEAVRQGVETWGVLAAAALAVPSSVVRGAMMVFAWQLVPQPAKVLPEWARAVPAAGVMRAQARMGLQARPN